MTDGSRDTSLPVIIEYHGSQIIQRQLQRSGALLMGNPTRHGTVDLVRQPVFTSYRLNLQYLLDILFNLIGTIFYFCKMLFYTLVVHDRLWRIPEHIGHLQIDRLLPGLPILEHEAVISGGFPHHVHRRTLTVCNSL